jgi:hypothetical protein
LLRQENIDGAVDQFLSPVAEQALNLDIGQHDQASSVNNNDAARTGFDREAEQFLCSITNIEDRTKGHLDLRLAAITWDQTGGFTRVAGTSKSPFTSRFDRMTISGAEKLKTPLNLIVVSLSIVAYSSE